MGCGWGHGGVYGGGMGLGEGGGGLWGGDGVRWGVGGSVGGGSCIYSRCIIYIYTALMICFIRVIWLIFLVCDK